MFFPFFLFFDAKSRPNGGVVGLLNRHAFFFCAYLAVFAVNSLLNALFFFQTAYFPLLLQQKRYSVVNECEGKS